MMKRFLGTATVLTMMSASAWAQDNPFALKADVYTVSVDKSLIYVVTRKDPNTLGSGLSHDHVIRATQFSGEVAWMKGNASKCQFDVTVKVSGLVNDEPDMRRTAGMADNLSDSNRADVKKAMLAADQLNAASHPTISFSSTSCSNTSGSDYNVTGELTLLGNTRSVTVPMSIKADGTNFGATGEFSINGSDYGLKPKKAMAGQIKNQDKIQFHITLGAKK